jgi:hypothetical protein
MFTPAQVDAAIRAHGTIFFDSNLNPVEPQVGEWFCEYERVIPEEADAFIRDESLVEYCGAAEVGGWDGSPVRTVHRVLPEYADCDRTTDCLFLVRQS